MAASESTQLIIEGIANALGGTTVFTDSTTLLGAGGTVNGNQRGVTADSKGRSPQSVFVAEAFSDVAGTLYIDKSNDFGATWRQVGSVAVPAGSSAQLSTRITCLAYRSRYVNGGAAQAAFLLTSAFTVS
jgi:hypothetical protein